MSSNQKRKTNTSEDSRCQTVVTTDDLTTIRSNTHVVEVQGEYDEEQECFALEVEIEILKLERDSLKAGRMPGWQSISVGREIDGAFWEATAVLDPEGRVSMSLTDTTGFLLTDDEEHITVWPRVEDSEKDEHRRLFGELKPRKRPKATKAEVAEGKKTMAELRRLAAGIKGDRSRPKWG